MNPVSMKILVVEDDLLCQSFIGDILERSGFCVEVAANGQEALERCQIEHFPIIITDLVMPVMDGLELCRKIRTMHFEEYVFILLMTSLDERDHLISGFEAGADEYIVKPVHEIELLSRLKAARRILALEATLRTLAMHDQLTGAFNRGYLDSQLLKEIKRTERYGHPLSIVMCDVDNFKSLNDRYGHQIGDLVLKEFVVRINNTIRCENDWFARYGGDEFVIVLPETDLEGCRIVAERIRRLIAESPVMAQGTAVDITISSGAVSVIKSDLNDAISVNAILDTADKCLYHAKESGRNCVIAAQC
ncbi:MAG: diguanylate cyclase [Geobacteraceae bacterium]|nr:diguanylate cyclase [Geobacteraceae bacterium]